MKVVLLEDVKKVGKKGEIVEVSDAYGRNVLIKKGLGLEGTTTNVNNAKQKQDSIAHHKVVANDEAKILAAQLTKVEVTVKFAWAKKVAYSVLLLQKTFPMQLKLNTK